MSPKHRPWQKLISNVYIHLGGGYYEEASDLLTMVLDIKYAATISIRISRLKVGKALQEEDEN